MRYSLLNAATLGFDLVRAPAGDRVADVLLTALTADAELLARLADAHPSRRGRVTEHRPRRRAHRAPVATRVGRAPTGRTGVPSTGCAAGPMGDLAGLEHVLRRDVLGPEHACAAEVGSAVVGAAADVLADAAVGWWHSGRLSSRDVADLTGPLAAVLDGAPPTRTVVHLDPAVLELLDVLEHLDVAGRARWRAAVATPPADPTAWAAAMHQATWAAHLTGRTRDLAGAHLLAVSAFRAGGLTPDDGVAGVWNAVAGSVHAMSVADLLPADDLVTLLAPWVHVTGNRAAPCR